MRLRTETHLLRQFGGFYTGADKQWQDAFVDYLISRGFGSFYFGLNPESVDTGGLLLKDWRTPETLKLKLLARLKGTSVDSILGKGLELPAPPLPPPRPPPSPPQPMLSASLMALFGEHYSPPKPPFMDPSPPPPPWFPARHIGWTPGSNADAYEQQNSYNDPADEQQNSYDDAATPTVRSQPTHAVAPTLRVQSTHSKERSIIGSEDISKPKADKTGANSPFSAVSVTVFMVVSIGFLSVRFNIGGTTTRIRQLLRMEPPVQKLELELEAVIPQQRQRFGMLAEDGTPAPKPRKKDNVPGWPAVSTRQESSSEESAQPPTEPLCGKTCSVDDVPRFKSQAAGTAPAPKFPTSKSQQTKKTGRRGSSTKTDASAEEGIQPPARPVCEQGNYSSGSGRGRFQGHDSRESGQDCSQGHDSRGSGRDRIQGKDSRGSGRGRFQGNDSRGSGQGCFQGHDSRGSGQDHFQGNDSRGSGQDRFQGKDSRGSGLDDDKNARRRSDSTKPEASTKEGIQPPTRPLCKRTCSLNEVSRLHTQPAALAISPGMKVKIHGLKSAHHHNGKDGVVIGQHEDRTTGRYKVRTQTGEILLLKGANLQASTGRPDLQSMINALERAGEHDKAVLLRSIQEG